MRQHATPRSFRRRATRRGVAGARVVRDHVVEVRLLPSGRSGTQAHADERPVEAREAAGSTPAGSAAGDAQARDTSISLDGRWAASCAALFSPASWTWCSGNIPGFHPGVVGSIPTVRTGTAM